MGAEEAKVTISATDPVDEATLARGASAILLCPLNWRSSDEYVYAESTDSVAKLFSQSGVPFALLSPITPETPLKEDRYADWIAPTFFVSGLLLSQNPMAVNLAMNVLANYVTDLFKGINPDPAVKLRIVRVAESKAAEELNYEGPVSGLSKIAEIVAEFKKD